MVDIQEVKQYLRSNAKNCPHLDIVVAKLDDVEVDNESLSIGNVKECSIAFLKRKVIPLLYKDIFEQLLWMVAWVLLMLGELAGYQNLQREGIPYNEAMVIITICTTVMSMAPILISYNIFKEIKWTHIIICSIQNKSDPN